MDQRMVGYPDGLSQCDSKAFLNVHMDKLMS